MRHMIAMLAAVSVVGLATPALAKAGDPVTIGDGVTLDPIIDLRLRYEGVEQDNAVQDADAVTARLRAGLELKVDGFFALVEGEGTLAIGDNYNDTIPGNGIEPFPVVADPDNIELNRAAIGYAKGGNSITVGRQRIIHDNARWVGNVGWRQNEQTFDAVRGQGKIGPVSLDATYAVSQRTIFGRDSPREYMDGDLILLNGGFDVKPIKVKAFAYLLDYDRIQPFNSLSFSSQTYGVAASGSIPLDENFKLEAMASYAHQSDYKDNPNDYSADYIAAELGASVAGFGLKVGYEELGADANATCVTAVCGAVQTPLATLHAFNGWADLFLTTPRNGLRDYYVGVSRGFKVKALPGLKVAASYHKFEADIGGADYGEEFDAQIGFSIGPVGILAKYADYNSDGFGVDTRKFWLQAEIKY